LHATCTNLHAASTAAVNVPDAIGGAPAGYDAKGTAFEGAFGNRTVQIYSAGAITSPTLAGSLDPSDPQYIEYTLTFVSNTPSFLVEFAGHLAVGGDNTGLTWPAGTGSSDINGGPYHFKLDAYDNEN